MLKSKNLVIYFLVILLYKSEEDVSSAGEQLTSNRIYGCEIQIRASFFLRGSFCISLPHMAKKISPINFRNGNL